MKPTDLEELIEYQRRQLLTLKVDVIIIVDALEALLSDTQHSKHHCSDENCPVKNAREVVSRYKG